MLVQLTDVTFRYPRGGFLLEVPALQIDRGERVAVIGPSGSGKTTLLHLVAGVVVPESGRIVVNEVEVSALDDAKRRDFRITTIGPVFQEFELLEYLSVLDNILLPYRITSALTLDRPVSARAAQLAGEVGIGDMVKRYTHQMSQGEKQRVAVCRALLPEPALLLADEPTGNLDPKNKDRVMDILVAYTERNEATLLTVTHDHSILDRFDRVIDMADFHGAPLPEPSDGDAP